MVVGKLLTLILVTNPAHGSSVLDPQFFEYRSGNFTNQLLTMTFGWFKTLNDADKEKYHAAINHAIFFAEDGHKIIWYGNEASGMAMPVMTWPTGSGYCRRIHIQASAYSMTKTMTASACYQNGTDNWTWYPDK